MQLNSFYKGNFDLGSAAMKINENNIINLIIEKIKKIKNYKKEIIGIMGVAFKAETDDIRDSLSIKLIKKLKKMKLKIIFTDEYYKNKNLTDLKLFLKKTDIIVLGAPHNKYYKIKFPTNKKYIDIWGVTKK
jgi:UDP-N-acetyl-D-mannosaminuronic acid dehydrogenase